MKHFKRIKNFVFPGVVLLPIVAQAAGLQSICEGSSCNFQKLIELINRFVNILFEVSIPIVAAVIAWAGFLYLTAGGDTGKIKKAHSMFWTIIVGFVFMLSAWLIIHLITSALLQSGYSYI